MAIPFVRYTVLSRTRGESAVAAAAYRSGTALADERYGITRDYRQKGGVIASGISAPVDAPEWANDRAKLWNAVEAIEKGAKAQIAREVLVAIPAELSPKGRDFLVRMIALDLSKQGMVVDWSLHRPDKGGDDRNYHAHLLCTMRPIHREGFEGKTRTGQWREWNKGSWASATKTRIAELTNAELELAGRTERISFARGPDAPPAQVHKGKALTRKLRREQAGHRAEADVLVAEIAAIEAEGRALVAEIAAEQEEETREQVPVDRPPSVEEYTAAWFAHAKRNPANLAQAVAAIDDPRIRDYRSPEVDKTRRQLLTLIEEQGLTFDLATRQLRPMTRSKILRRDNGRDGR